MKLFGCRGCEAHQAHIKSLLAQIESLNKLVFPTSAPISLSMDNLEANVVLNGQQEVIDVTPSEEEKELIEAQYEVDKILSGNY